jgi:7-keto-8-aminopelargonate synthetase-like enzyme
VLPVVEPAVPAGLSRLCVNVTAAHGINEIDRAVSVFQRAARQVGVLV